MGTFEAATTATITSALGVTVERTSAVDDRREAFEYGPPPSPPPPSPGDGLPVMLLLAGVGGAVVVQLALAAVCHPR